MLDNLKAKVRTRDEERVQNTRPLTMADVETPGEPKPNQMEENPA